MSIERFNGQLVELIVNKQDSADFDCGAEIRRSGHLPCGLNHWQARGWVDQDEAIRKMAAADR